MPDLSIHICRPIQRVELESIAIKFLSCSIDFYLISSCFIAVNVQEYVGYKCHFTDVSAII